MEKFMEDHTDEALCVEHGHKTTQWCRGCERATAIRRSLLRLSPGQRYDDIDPLEFHQGLNANIT
jgi:hypothetical protein